MRRQTELRAVANRGASIQRNDILLFCTLRNEKVRLPYFLDYYRRLGVRHFLFVDNGSTDGSAACLADQPDVSLWTTEASYKRARYGMDWLNGLLTRFGAGHWVVVVDADEFLVYPHVDTRPLTALTEWLDARGRKSFGTMLLDMYSEATVAQTAYAEGDDPFAVLTHFDAGNYFYKRSRLYLDMWIQGGPRQRVFFPDRPSYGPALNKVPLVRWRRGFAYRSSTHALLPRGLNRTYAPSPGERACGLLLHAKFLDSFSVKAEEELTRGQHYAASREYTAYASGARTALSFATPHSTKLRDWRQLEALGLMSRGSWA
ncbi:MAG: glycosyltransferase family 2 protein [Pseudomonadota bacterium]